MRDFAARDNSLLPPDSAAATDSASETAGDDGDAQAVPIKQQEQEAEARERLPYVLEYFADDLRGDLVAHAAAAGIQIPADVQAAAKVLSAWADRVIGQIEAEFSADTPTPETAAGKAGGCR